MNKRKLSAVASVAGALLLAIAAGCSGDAAAGTGTTAATATTTVAPATITAPAADTRTAFDADRAFSDLKKQVDFGPRVPNTKTHDACRDWLLAEMNKATGNQAKLQNFTQNIRGVDLKMSNIYAAFNPQAKTQVLLCAHWDTRPTADMEIDPEKKKQPIPGADDGASGVAVLLEVARNFTAKNPTAGVQIVLFDGEDYGPGLEYMLLGAAHYAKHPALPKPTYAILIDMIGDKNLKINREKNSDSLFPEINDKVFSAAQAVGATGFQNTPGLDIQDDHIPMQASGFKIVDLIDFENYAPWHTLADTPDKCSPDSLKQVGMVLEKVVYDEK